ncbi:MAG TPA: hypothetical protein VJT31_07435 [Rugosimonospora sp.]|nr:hypothetical protein [Rugosimonospora sp.]
MLLEQIADPGRRQDRLIAELETTDPADRTFRDRLRHRFDALEAERADKAAQIQALEKERESTSAQDVELLDALPIIRDLNITDAPEAIQRRLYDAFQFDIRVDRTGDGDHAGIRLALNDETVGMLRAVAGEKIDTRAHRTGSPPRIRTCKTQPDDHRAVPADCTLGILLGNGAGCPASSRDPLGCD